MDLSTFVAQIAAVAYLSIGVGMLVDKKHYKKLFDSILKDMSVMYLGGFMALIAGFAIVTFHNVWVQDWTILITIIGWLALIKGVLLLVFPSVFMKWVKTMFKTKHLSRYSFVILFIGLVFGYFGFVA